MTKNEQVARTARTDTDRINWIEQTGASVKHRLGLRDPKLRWHVSRPDDVEMVHGATWRGAVDRAMDQEGEGQGGGGEGT